MGQMCMTDAGTTQKLSSEVKDNKRTVLIVFVDLFVCLFVCLFVSLSSYCLTVIDEVSDTPTYNMLYT